MPLEEKLNGEKGRGVSPDVKKKQVDGNRFLQ